MIAFDTDVPTELFLLNARYVDRAATNPASQQAVPVVIMEEIIKANRR